MRIHCISHGGRVTSSLAIQLKLMGHDVTGHDDEIYEPSKSALAAHGLLADIDGRYPESITSEIDMIVLGMHARADNPELLRAQELGLTIRSYPEVVYDLSKDKTRAVIAGSHGKTTTTSMVMHVLKGNNVNFDWVVGGIVPGFDTMVNLGGENDIIIIEGDEYPDGKINMSAKMLLYKHDIMVLNGIAWDHITTYPTFESYVAPFQHLVDQTPEDGYIGYYDQDIEVMNIMNSTTTQAQSQAYDTHPHTVRDGITHLTTTTGQEVALSIFGAHNCINISAAKLLCNRVGVSDEQFYTQIGSFVGAGNRLEKIYDDGDDLTILRDFAHSPSKLTATVSAVRAQYSDRKVIGVFELHTFASLSASFLPEYAGSMSGLDHACVYYDQHALDIKHMPSLDPQQVKDGFDHDGLVVCDNPASLKSWYDGLDLTNSVVVLMSSGNFGGVEFIEHK